MHYTAILNAEEAKAQVGVSAAVEKTKATTFICRRLQVLLNHLAANVSAKNVKEIIRLLMPFVQGALESIEDDQRISYLFESCQVVNTLFCSIV